MAVHVLDAMAREGFEEILAIHDRRSGLRAFVGVHDTSAGPAHGGVRRFSYRDERSALMDALRLSLAMSRKCALADVPAGGGKIVVLDRPGLDLPAAYRHLGDVVERLGGRYYAGPDVGTDDRELGWIAERTRHVTPPGEAGPGNLAGATSAGVFAGLAAALRALDGREDWPGRTVVVQGLGRVGASLAERLSALGARVLGSDLDDARAREVRRRAKIELVAPGTEFDVECDVFSPCAMGGILHDLTIQRLAARVVCGAANNPLSHARQARRLFERGVLYVPDFVVNAGAVLAGSSFRTHGRALELQEIERRIGGLTERVLATARAEELSPWQVALREADERIRRRRDGAVAPAGSREVVREPERGGAVPR